MNKELYIYKSLGNSLPNIPSVTGIVNRGFKKMYFRTSNRKKEKYLQKVNGFKMLLEPYENVDGALFFYPQLYERKEFNFLKEILQTGDCFIDIGANIGAYSLIASNLIGNEGKVVAIEAEPYNFKKLKKNISLNEINNIDAINLGVSDKSETLSLSINTTGNRSGCSFAYEGENTVKIKCKSLIDILDQSKITKISCMKIDIEGFEYKVLKHFYDSADRNLFPKYIIMEHLHSSDNLSPIELLLKNDYEIIDKNYYNLFLRLKPNKN
ncbi:FkbM family methyltransferase [Mangrovimonas futianensis]|uniref:FkbM family methyltransferase n=1 Tax=Mangrovimonas futianensis TaxID=2895523 RepID=UPI001E2EA123|nr:FkbM family methyltransferase [Mangrovimonas futianensis]MCF1422161.1 FkbM family methyltransferase [Mangrovimonas futianensis]